MGLEIQLAWWMMEEKMEAREEKEMDFGGAPRFGQPPKCLSNRPKRVSLPRRVSLTTPTTLTTLTMSDPQN